MLLKMRSLPPKATPRPDTGILKAVEGSDENAIRWFEMIQVSRKSPLLLSCPVQLTNLYQLYTLNNDKLPYLIHMTRDPWIFIMGRNCCRLPMSMHDLLLLA